MSENNEFVGKQIINYLLYNKNIDGYVTSITKLDIYLYLNKNE